MKIKKVNKHNMHCYYFYFIFEKKIEFKVSAKLSDDMLYLSSSSVFSEDRILQDRVINSILEKNKLYEEIRELIEFWILERNSSI